MELALDPEDVAIAIPKLLSLFRVLAVQVKDSEDPFNLIRASLEVRNTPLEEGRVFQALFSVPLNSNLHFSFITFYRKLPTVNELNEELDGYTLTLEKVEIENILTFTVELPQHFSTGSVCRICFNRDNSVDCSYYVLE